LSTLYTQPPRDHFRVGIEDLSAFVQDAAAVATKQKISLADVIAAAHVLQMARANDLYRANGDAFDEQLGGLGEELQRIASAIEGLREGG
jgi:hypothetical protein